MVIDSTKIVRVLSYNIYHGETVGADKKFDLDLLAKVINDVQPDLVALQEVDNKTKRARNYDLVTELGLRTKMAPLFGKAMDFDGGGYGEGVLSRYSFLSTQNHALPVRENKEPRAALEVQVQLKSGDTIRFVGTHLDHTKDSTDRINQAVALNKLFSDSDMPTILTGDLNAEPTSEAMQILFEEWSASHKNSEFTYPADNPRIKIDYVLFRPAHRWRVIESRVIDESIASDHRPILTVLELVN
ncbi:MAG: hypothetical protein BM563_03930 [Bacteroidetes bacterium MedPE-SWsnd-G1]|nr:MAG: hypothetical protein BM563_03930 [Bacteroidetes bacterium MedPE-SWsnd-G1]